jgi:hypothetical protein
LAAVIVALAGTLEAQHQGPLQVGARIRVSTDPPDPEHRTGTFAGLAGSDLRLSSGGTTVSVPVAAIRRLELSTGRSPGLAGGIVGGLLGVGVGGFLGCVANRDSYGVLCGGQDDTKVIVGAALGGLAGGLAGALLFRRERWEPIDPSRLSR